MWLHIWLSVISVLEKASILQFNFGVVALYRFCISARRHPKRSAIRAHTHTTHAEERWQGRADGAYAAPVNSAPKFDSDLMRARVVVGALLLQRLLSACCYFVAERLCVTGTIVVSESTVKCVTAILLFLSLCYYLCDHTLFRLCVQVAVSTMATASALSSLFSSASSLQGSVKNSSNGENSDNNSSGGSPKCNNNANSNKAAVAHRLLVRQNVDNILKGRWSAPRVEQMKMMKVW